MYRRLAIIVAFLAVVLLLAGAYGGLVWWKWAAQPAQPGVKAPVRVTVEKGTSPTSVGKALERRGVIRSWRVFAYRGRNYKIRPGVYDISPSESPADILRRLERGDIATNRVTFPEGFTVKQMAQRLEKQRLIPSAEAFLQLVTEQGDTLEATFALPKNLEGYLFPDTYKFPVSDDAKAIAQRMLDNFARLVVQGKAEAIKRSGRSLHEIVVIASMIEREAEVEADRATIAGVIYNRLDRGMKLEIDATVQYARGEHKSRLLFRDLEVDSPYNTYRRVGLPPGPICNPGMPSIEAALHPARHDYLFYVARADGSHVFGRTYAEHLRNIAQVRSQR